MKTPVLTYFMDSQNQYTFVLSFHDSIFVTLYNINSASDPEDGFVVFNCKYRSFNSAFDGYFAFLNTFTRCPSKATYFYLKRLQRNTSNYLLMQPSNVNDLSDSDLPF